MNEQSMITENMQAAVDLMDRGVSGIVRCINKLADINHQIDELIKDIQLSDNPKPFRGGLYKKP